MTSSPLAASPARPRAATTDFSRGRRDLLDISGVAILVVVTLSAAAGYAIFALHPERVAAMPSAGLAYGVALRWFPPGQIVVSVLALAAILTRRTGAAWVPAALVLYAISLASELLGTTVGIPFGAYRYTGGLGIKWFAHVPVLIPASWFMMAIPAFALATRWITARRATRVLVAAALLVSWDLALDPAMSRLMPYWIWAEPGSYYGMPLLNLAGWYVTGVALMLALDLMRADRWIRCVPTMPLAGVYLANLALPVLMSFAAGIWPAAVLAVVPIGLAAAIGAARERRAL